MTPFDTLVADQRNLISNLPAGGGRASVPDSPIKTAYNELDAFPWVYPPPNFQAFDYSAALQVPSPPSGDAVIYTFTVPNGMDGVIKRFSHNYTGPGFQQGSGALIWRMLLNGQAVRNYEAMTVELGSTASPRTTDGIILQSGQVFKYVINNPSMVVGNVLTVITVGGYFWPRR